jgi:predicted nucleic acid-binding protein
MEAIKTVIDTDLLIDLLRNQNQAAAFIVGLEQKNTILATTAVNVFELYHGAHKSQKSEKNLEAIKVLIGRLSILPLTEKAAKKAAQIYAEQEKSGQPIGLRDTFIAAIALTRDACVATRNKEHFNRIAGLKIITPSI